MMSDKPRNMTDMSSPKYIRQLLDDQNKRLYEAARERDRLLGIEHQRKKETHGSQEPRLPAS